MADILRVRFCFASNCCFFLLTSLQVVMHFLPGQSVNVHLVETSLSMRATQKAHLAYADQTNVKLNWHDSIDEISPSPFKYTMLVAHEFFDALPIHILKVRTPSFFPSNLTYSFEQKAENGEWHEVLVASSIDQKTQEETSTIDSPEAPEFVASTSSASFRYVLAPQPSPISTVLGFSSPRFKELPAGSTLEVSPTSFKIARKVGELLASGSSNEKRPSIGGSGLIIDYGASRAFDNSLRVCSTNCLAEPLFSHCFWDIGIPKPQDRGRVPRTRKY
jgi:NADH dehydrogenase [ubiquinone] 1 alpha subcomplex assembly factor 7